MPIQPPALEELVKQDIDHLCADEKAVCVRMVAVANLPTRFGHFRLVGFVNNRDGKDHIAIIRGDVCGQADVPTRVHSECLTGDALGSLRCDCRDQLEKSLKLLGDMDRGVLLYLRQEGRGIGLVNKIRAYQIQDHGYDTVEANELLGFRADERDYEVAAHMLRSLKVPSIRLMTNNPHKIEQLRRYGLVVTDRMPLEIPPNEFNRQYLETKRKKSGHLLELLKTQDAIEQEEHVA